ncbi:MAG TPA: TrbC/VirB2 family protein [Vicinamibacterales bacterium]|nr:TrbC/VirB2 family protein [Vicinamibacterales bacterium]
MPTLSARRQIDAVALTHPAQHRSLSVVRREDPMQVASRTQNSSSFIPSAIQRAWIALVMLLMSPASSFAQSPWERAAANLEASFTGPLARSLALVAIVIGGLMFMFGEGGAKRQISGIVFGGGLCLFAVQFLTWLF